MGGGDGCRNGWSVNKGGRGCGGGPAWFVGWWRATNAKQVSTTFGENVLLLGLFVAGGLPTLSFLLSFLWLVCWLVQLAWLVVCLGLEKTHTVMDGSWTGQKCNSLARWLLGLLAVIACVIQCLMDMQSFCLCAWLMDGWMDGSV